MKTSARFAVLAAASLAAAACTATYNRQPSGGYGAPQVTLDTPGGYFPIYSEPAVPAYGSNLAAPPGFAAAGGPLPTPGGGWQDGTYDGTATLLENDSGDCAFNFAMENMHVNNGRVRFARFHGRVGPDGGVRMADGSLNWITGHFRGSHFSGAFSDEYCAYALSLDRVGP
jgi:hypothetical protein